MKLKIFYILLIAPVFLLISSITHAQSDEVLPESPIPGENIAVPLDEEAEITGDTSLLDEEFILSTGEIVIFTHEDCPHCANVEKFVELNGIANDVEYIPLKNNDENLDKLEVYWDYFEVSEAEMGWPFMVYATEVGMDYSVGDEPIIDDLVTLLSIEEPVSSSPDNQGSNDILLVVGGVFFLAVVGYGVYTLLSKKDAGKK